MPRGIDSTAQCFELNRQSSWLGLLSKENKREELFPHCQENLLIPKRFLFQFPKHIESERGEERGTVVHR